MEELAAQNRQEGKNDFAGYYQIPYATLIQKGMVRMMISVEDDQAIQEKDLKAAAKKLDASDLPDGDYDSITWISRIKIMNPSLINSTLRMDRL